MKLRISQSSLRVIHLITALGAGGAENGIINLVNNHHDSSVTSAICVFNGGGVLTERVNQSKTKIFELDKKKKGNDYSLIFKLNRLFREWKPDIVHTHTWGTLCEGIIAAKLAYVPKIVHGEHGTIQSKPINKLVQKGFWYLPDQVLSVSLSHAKTLNHVIGFPLSKIHVIPNGVDTSKFYPLPSNGNKTEVIQKNSEGLTFGTIGRLMLIKNQVLLIKAFTNIVKSNPEARLVLTGDGPLRDELEQKAKSLSLEKNISFLGRRSDIPSILRNMDVFILPSLSEGMSNTILEAMSTGKPVIATDVGGNSELVVPDETGILVPSDDVKALETAMRIFINAPELIKKMGAAGRKKVIKSFSIQSMVNNYEALYQDLMNQKPPN